MPTSRSKSASACTSRSPPPYIILTKGELRAALDRQREFPKYLIEGIPKLELPLATDPVQRETFFCSGIPTCCRQSSPFARAIGADVQRCVLDPWDQVDSGQIDVVLNTMRGSTLQGC